MKQNFSRLRTLSRIEQAFTISNEAAPLCVVCVLQLSNGPEIHELKAALVQLQARHGLLRAGISQSGGDFFFHRLDPVPPLPLAVVDRKDTDTWQGIAEQALNTIFDRQGPLLKCWYLPGPAGGDSELIVCFHHAIIDGTAARLLLHELLGLCGGLVLPEVPSPAPLPAPAHSKGNPVAFAGRQLKEEWQYRKTGVASPIPPHSRNAIISLRLSPALSRKLSVRAGREGFSLNSVLLAAITLAVLRHRHGQAVGRRARVVSFADLRSSFVPAVPDQDLGCYISMLRFSIPVSREPSAWQLAAQLRRAMFRASRRGEVFLMARMSKYLVKLVLRMQNTRLGVSALSFIGKLDLEPQYGPVRLHHVMAFITNNRFGPEFSAFGKVLFGAIGLDFTYLTAEMSAEQAGRIAKEIQETLEKMADLP